MADKQKKRKIVSETIRYECPVCKEKYASIKKAEKAKQYARMYHKGQFRRSSELPCYDCIEFYIPMAEELCLSIAEDIKEHILKLEV